MSKKGERRNQSPRKHRRPQPRTGPKKDNIPGGFRKQSNAIDGDMAKAAFIPKI